MAYVSRGSFFKQSTKTVLSIKQTNKLSVRDRQIKGRESIITRKRLKVNSTLEARKDLRNLKSEEEENEQVIRIIHHLKKGDKLNSLSDLHQLFANFPSNSDVFIKNDGLQSLHTCFKSLDVDILHMAAWCFINLTATTSSSHHSLLGLAPTLLQFLKGSDGVMQELCAWGLANLAGDGPVNIDVLHSQGCTDTLIHLINTTDYLASEERTRSVLFALVNLARNNATCIQYMYEKDIYSRLHELMKSVSVESTLNFEIGWLFNSIYPGCDSNSLASHHYPEVTMLLCKRLNHLADKMDPFQRDRVCFPFVRCLSNLIGVNQLMARVVLDSIRTLNTIADLLVSDSDSLKQEVLRLINNCMVDVCSRVLLTLDPNVLYRLLLQFQLKQIDSISLAFQIIQAMVRTSMYIDAYLLNQGVLSSLLLVIKNVICPEGSIHFKSIEQNVYLLKTIIDILLVLVSSQPDLVKDKLNKEEPDKVSVLLTLLRSLKSNQMMDRDLIESAVLLIGHLDETIT